MATRWFIVLSIILAGLDQLTKFLSRQLVDPETLRKLMADEAVPVRNEIIQNFYYLTLTFNKGIAWGMLPEWSEYFTYFAIVMVLVILMILGKLDRDEVWLKIALAFQMAGAFGNMTDRLIFQKVTDFLDVTLFPGTGWEYDWPIFNLADSFVVVGTMVLVLVLLFARENPRLETVAKTDIPVGQKRLQVDGELSGPTRLQGSVPTDEALVEIPPEPGSEMLIPFEDADSAHPEEIEGQFGDRADNFTEQDPKPAPDDDRDKLDELSRRPEPDE